VNAVFDVQVFDQLISDLDSRVIALDFLSDFTGMLDDRINAIEHALKVGALDETKRALHSLRSSAAMIGARQLDAATTLALEDTDFGATAVGPLVRKLQGQADHFRTASAAVRTDDSLPAYRVEAQQRA
jgi:HPt (histidine-containing phosphotransfer) domain-containing protein